MKPFKGRIRNWDQIHISKATDEHLGFYIIGVFDGHPAFDGHRGHTSMVVKETELEDGTIEIETLNSKYILEYQGYILKIS